MLLIVPSQRLFAVISWLIALWSAKSPQEPITGAHDKQDEDSSLLHKNRFVHFAWSHTLGRCWSTVGMGLSFYSSTFLIDWICPIRIDSEAQIIGISDPQSMWTRHEAEYLNYSDILCQEHLRYLRWWIFDGLIAGIRVNQSIFMFFSRLPKKAFHIRRASTDGYTQQYVVTVI